MGEKCLLGIIGTGRIAKRFAKEITYVPEIELSAVYNPHILSAEKFAAQICCGMYTDNLESFLSEVDAVYIASPHATHYEYAKKALSSGKHVMCEKPMTLCKAEAEELCRLSQKNNRVLMESIKTAYCPGYQDLRRVIREGTIGRVIGVEAAFTRLTSSNVRECNDTEFGGSFTEFGTYGMLPVFDFLGLNFDNVRFASVFADNGIDLYTKAFFDYYDPERGGGTENFRNLRAEAVVTTGLGVKGEGQLLITGTKGYILSPSPWWLNTYFEVRFEDPNHIEKHENAYEGDGLRYEIKAFRDAIESESSREMCGKEEIKRASVMEMFLNGRNKK